jgi:molybdopterin synthase catalytic subunit
MIRTGIVDEVIDPARVVSGFPDPGDGACLLFLGVVRDHNEGREVVKLEYEVYREMAEQTLAEIAREAGERFGTDRITLVHRVGELLVGEIATAIAVSTPHRAEAYQASRFIIEELKSRLPIWKREHYREGDAAWTGGTHPGGTNPSSLPGSGEGDGDG